MFSGNGEDTDRSPPDTAPSAARLFMAPSSQIKEGTGDRILQVIQNAMDADALERHTTCLRAHQADTKTTLLRIEKEIEQIIVRDKLRSIQERYSEENRAELLAQHSALEAIVIRLSNAISLATAKLNERMNGAAN